MNIPTPFPEDGKPIRIELFMRDGKSTPPVRRADNDGVGPENVRGELPRYKEVADLPCNCAASLAGRSVPLRQWIVRNLIPDGNVTLVSGAGAVRKSVLALQPCVAVPTGTLAWEGDCSQAGPVPNSGRRSCRGASSPRRHGGWRRTRPRRPRWPSNLRPRRAGRRDGRPGTKAAVPALTPIWHGLLKLVEIQIDRDLRVLSLKKMNYGPRGRRRVIGEGAHD